MLSTFSAAEKEYTWCQDNHTQPTYEKFNQNANK